LTITWREILLFAVLEVDFLRILPARCGSSERE
jgi:hypothetical protein